MKKLIIFLYLFNLTNLTVLAECTTGYACSIKELEKQAMEKIKEDKKFKEENNKKNLLKEINDASKKETTKIIKDINQSI